jgi:glycosyltransferase involved in cell wall biosynthesis
MTPPLVSIVVATYRSRPDHLTAALRSALAQTYAHVEIIVCDDSPDDTLRALVAGFGDPRLRYRHNRPALGVARNHWVSFAEARGEYVAVLNHDDWFAPTFVESLVDALQSHSTASLAFCDHWIIDAHGQKLDRETERNTAAWGRSNLTRGAHQPFTGLVVNQSVPMAMGALFRKSALPAELSAEAGPAYDLWLTYYLCREGAAAWYCGERLSAWRTHESNLTSEGGLPWLRGASLCWQTMSRDVHFSSHRATVREKAAQGFYACAVRSWADGESLTCLRYAVQSVGAACTVKGLFACLLPLLPARWAALRTARRQQVKRA